MIKGRKTTHTLPACDAATVKPIMVRRGARKLSSALFLRAPFSLQNPAFFIGGFVRKASLPQLIVGY